MYCIAFYVYMQCKTYLCHLYNHIYTIFDYSNHALGTLSFLTSFKFNIKFAILIPDGVYNHSLFILIAI